MNYFTVIDLTLFGIFVIFISIFLYRKRKNLKKEGLLLLYKTSWGMKVIDKVSKNTKPLEHCLCFIGIFFLWDL